MTPGYRGIRMARAVLMVSLLIGAQVGVVRQVQWVRHELELLERSRAGRSQAEAEIHRLERELATDLRPDVIARRAEDLGLRPTRSEDLLFVQGENAPVSVGFRPPCVGEVLRGASLGPQ